jgi:SAM-dependent methyltransferase
MNRGACPLCGSSDTELLTNRLRFGRVADVRRCHSCSLVFLDQSSFQFPAGFYEAEYHQTYLTHVDPDMLDPARHFEKMRSATRPWIERVRDMLSGGEAVLDVGCSTGHLLDGIRDRAAKLCGHELSRKEVAFCRDVLRLDVADVPLEERFEAETFDLITLIFVLEHIGDPVVFLANLKRYLKPGGRLVIVVPNVLDPLLAFYRIPQFAEFYYCIEHLFYYSPRTLGRVLEQAGFAGTPEAVQEYPITNHLNWAYRQRPAETLAARRLVPDVELADEKMMGDWEAFWKGVDVQYGQFMMQAGYSDRVWCIAKVAE